MDLVLGGIACELREKHGSTYSLPQVRLWAEMIGAGHHESTILAITPITPKQKSHFQVHWLVLL